MTFRPLAGLLVVEVGHDLSAAFGARLLADLGAEVIKVEPPVSGDPVRREGPLVSIRGQSASALFAYLNYGKRSISLDIAAPEGAKILKDLLARSDLIIAAPGRPGSTPMALDLESFDPLTRPVLVSVSPHGLMGPRSGQPSSPFVLQHAAGFAFHQASPVVNPETTPPTAGAESEGALAIGIVVANSALWALSAIEPGQPKPFVDISAEDVYAYLLVEPFADWCAGVSTRERQRDPTKPSMVAGGLVWLLPCADGAVMISPREDHQWERWLEVMGRPHWAFDAELCGDRTIRTRHASAIGHKMSEWSVQQKCQDVFAKAQAQRVACFPISTAKDMVNNAQLIERKFYSKLRLAEGIVVPAPGLPFQIRTSSGEMLERGREVAAPDLGEANFDVFGTKLGMVRMDIEQLKEQGVI
jgi:crotonobetainyl-CoA:carnitine CoA-transferase CaiB-like acyl-CoA transferase